MLSDFTPLEDTWAPGQTPSADFVNRAARAINFIIGNGVFTDTDTFSSTSKINQDVTLTQAEFDAIATPDPNTDYIIIEPNAQP